MIKTITGRQIRIRRLCWHHPPFPGRGGSRSQKTRWGKLLERNGGSVRWMAVKSILEKSFIFPIYYVEKAMTPHSSTLAWKIPWTEEPGGLPSMVSHRVGHDWGDLAAAAAAYITVYIHIYSTCIYIVQLIKIQAREKRFHSVLLTKLYHTRDLEYTRFLVQKTYL